MGACHRDVIIRSGVGDTDLYYKHNECAPARRISAGITGASVRVRTREQAHEVQVRYGFIFLTRASGSRRVAIERTLVYGIARTGARTECPLRRGIAIVRNARDLLLSYAVADRPPFVSD